MSYDDNPFSEYQQEEEETPLHDQHPQQNTFTFTYESEQPKMITISSEFDSGNIALCQDTAPYSYSIFMSEDGLPYSAKGHYRTWFYFSVTGVPTGQALIFAIKNMNNQGRLYKAGLKPVYRVLPTAQKRWKRIPEGVECGKGSEGFCITFSFTCTYSQDDVYYFAFSYPFSLEECLKQG